MPEETKTKKQRSRRGGGYLFQKVKGGLWHIQYYAPDPETGRRKCVKQCAKTRSKSDAQKLLTDRLAGVTKGVVLAVKPATVKELYEALLNSPKYKSDQKRKVKGVGWRWKHLAPFFAYMPSASVTKTLVDKYTSKRLDEKAAPATVNRELATLKRMFHYGKQSGIVHHDPPYIEMLKENNARQGFVEQADFNRMAVEAAKEGLWLRAFVELAFTYGWRRGELINLRVRQTDFSNRTIRLDPGTTKNEEGREVYMTDGVLELLRALCDGKQPNDHVFTRNNGSPVKDFRGAWRNMCVRAGLGEYRCAQCDAAWAGERCECGSRKRNYEGLIPHDFRRSAAKALRRAGVPESVIMATGGWKTASMFRRYAIVSSADQRDAMKTLEEARAAARAVNPLNDPSQQKPEPVGIEQARVTVQ